MIDYPQMYADALAGYQKQKPRGDLKVSKWSFHGGGEKDSMIQLKSALTEQSRSKGDALTTFFNGANFASDGYSFAHYLLDELVQKVRGIQMVQQIAGLGVNQDDKQFLQDVASLIGNTTQTKVKDALVAALLAKAQSVNCPDIVWTHLQDIFNRQTIVANVTVASVLNVTQKSAFVDALIAMAQSESCPDIVWDTMQALMVNRVLSSAERNKLNAFLLWQIGSSEFSGKLAHLVYEVMMAQDNASVPVLLAGLLNKIALKQYSPSLLGILSYLTGENCALTEADQMKVYRTALQLVEPATTSKTSLTDRLFPKSTHAVATQEDIRSPLLLCTELANKLEAAFVMRQLCNFMVVELIGYDARVEARDKGRYLQFIAEDNLAAILTTCLRVADVSELYSQTASGQLQVKNPTDEDASSQLPMAWVFLQFLTRLSTSDVCAERGQNLKSMVLARACDEAINANDMGLWQKLCAAIDTLDTDAKNVGFRQTAAPVIMRKLLLENKLDMLQAFVNVGGKSWGPFSNSFSISVEIVDQICQQHPEARSLFVAEPKASTHPGESIEIQMRGFLPAVKAFLTRAIAQNPSSSGSAVAPAELVASAQHSTKPGEALDGSKSGSSTLPLEYSQGYAH